MESDGYKRNRGSEKKRVTGYKRNRGSEKKRGKMSICEGRGKEKTNNGSGVELIKCQPFLNHWKWAQLTM